MSVEQSLLDLGCAAVSVAFQLQDAVRIAETEEFDAAVLDVNLAGTEVFPLADVLARRGIPFVFATGYGPEAIRADLRGRPLIRKPFQPRDLKESIARFVARASN